MIPTPPGLAANGLDKVLLMCAVQQGRTRKIPERFEHYFNLGVDVLSGKDNWEESLAEGKAPHETRPCGEVSGVFGEPPPAAPRYKRWKPER